MWVNWQKTFSATFIFIIIVSILIDLFLSKRHKEDNNKFEVDVKLTELDNELKRCL